jgi:iron complex outermembrane receptor protein
MFIGGQAELLFAQFNHVIVSGLVIDVESHLPLPDAVIWIPELNRYAEADNSGVFEFRNVPHGHFSLQVSFIGYKKYNQEIDVSGNDLLGIIIHLVPIPLETSAVVVTGEHHDSRFDDLHEFANVLKGKELERDLGTTLASTLRNETGLAIRSMGPAPARPVIRGLGSDRVYIIEDGFKSNDLSATSPDHAVTVEPFTIERVEVLRGARVLLHNSTTIGGIVNIIRGEIPESLPPGIKGSAGLYGETMNMGYLGAVTTEVPLYNFVLRGEFSGRKTSNLRTPAGVLGNSAIKTMTYSGGLSYIGDWGFTGLSFREYETDYGIPGGFVGAHPNGVNINMYKKDFNGKFSIKLDTKFLKDFELLLARTYYHHTEYESADLIGAEYAIYNYTGSLNLNTSGVGPFNSGTIGISSEYKDFNIGGYVFTPPTKSYKYSGYLFQQLNIDRTSFEVSARYNYDLLQPEPENITSRKFNTFSIALSGMYELTDELFAGATLSRSSRVPTIEELFSEGPHLAAYSYDIGNPDLEDERGFGSEVFMYKKNENYFFNFVFFWNDLSYYIIPRNTGTINFNTLLPVYQASGVPAVFYGSEVQLDYMFTSRLSTSASFSYTRGTIQNTDEPLPAIPPLKGLFEIKYNLFTDFLSGLSVEGAAEQNRTDIFEEPTAGYVIANLFFQYSISAGDNLISNFSLNIENIFNKEYRNHLSRLKSIVPEPGRNFRLTCRLYF